MSNLRISCNLFLTDAYQFYRTKISCKSHTTLRNGISSITHIYINWETWIIQVNTECDVLDWNCKINIIFLLGYTAIGTMGWFYWCYSPTLRIAYYCHLQYSKAINTMFMVYSKCKYCMKHDCGFYILVWIPYN